MAEYIEREAIKYEQWSVGPLCAPIMVVRKNTIDNIPAADVAPVVHGRWEPKRKMYRTPNAKNYTCSECGLPIAERWHYCPNCGARMDGARMDDEV